jgi:hypothetical protein
MESSSPPNAVEVQLLAGKDLPNAPEAIEDLLK